MSLQIVEPVRKKPPTRELFSQGIRDPVYSQVFAHCRSIWETARALGLQPSQVQDIAVQEAAKHMTKAYEEGYRRGRLSVTPPGWAA